MPETPTKRALRALRAAEKKKRGSKFTQVMLAEESGVALSNIEKYESGHSTPDIDNAIKLARFYGVSVASLLGTEEGGGVSKSELVTDPEAPEAGWAGDRTADAIMDVLGRTPEAVRRAEGVVDLGAAAEIGYKLALRIQLPATEMEKIMAWRRALLDAAASD